MNLWKRLSCSKKKPTWKHGAIIYIKDSRIPVLEKESLTKFDALTGINNPIFATYFTFKWDLNRLKTAEVGRAAKNCSVTQKTTKPLEKTLGGN